MSLNPPPSPAPPPPTVVYLYEDYAYYNSTRWSTGNIIYWTILLTFFCVLFFCILGDCYSRPAPESGVRIRHKGHHKRRQHDEEMLISPEGVEYI